MIHLYTGDGKGKTTAAAGLCIRAAGTGMRVIFSQFMKGNDTGELHVLERIENVRILRSTKQFGFYKTLGEAQKAELTKIHNMLLDQILEAAENRTCDLVVLDEITYPVSWGLVDVSKVKQLIAMEKEAERLCCQTAAAKREVPQAMPLELVFTGRNAAEFLTDCADYVTEMKAVRHPFEKGITARKGIEY